MVFIQKCSSFSIWPGHTYSVSPSYLPACFYELGNHKELSGFRFQRVVMGICSSSQRAFTTGSQRAQSYPLSSCNVLGDCVDYSAASKMTPSSVGSSTSLNSSWSVLQLHLGS
ncbi:unnamed protein product [Eretmochelys imbricata]